MINKVDYGARAREWWGELQKNGAARARLRRCRTPLDALLIPQTLTLMQRLGWRRERGERVAALAAVLAHVRVDDSRPVARAIGREKMKDTNALVSEGRFRRLMAVHDAAELQAAMTRLVAHLGGRANVTDLANSMLWWTDRTRANWAYDYYAAGRASAASEAETEEKIDG